MSDRNGYKETEIGPLPRDWDVIRIGAFAEVRSGATPSRKVSEYYASGTILTGRVRVKVPKEA